MNKKDFKDEEEEYRAKIIPQQIDETKAALKDTEQRLQKGSKIKSLRKYSFVNKEYSDKTLEDIIYLVVWKTSFCKLGFNS